MRAIIVNCIMGFVELCLFFIFVSSLPHPTQTQGTVQSTVTSVRTDKADYGRNFGYLQPSIKAPTEQTAVDGDVIEAPKTKTAATVYYDVLLDTQADVHTVILGQNVVVPCGKRKVNAKAVRWVQKGNNVTSKCNIVSDGSLYFSSFQVIDSGLFQCYVNKRLRFQADIRAVDPPRFVQPILSDLTDRPIGQPITADSSNDITILCRGSGYPKPVNSWTVDGIQLPSPQRSRLKIRKDGSLVIKNLQESDSGAYTCNVSNSAGSSSKTSVVVIQNQPSKPNIDRTARRQVQLKRKKWVAYIGKRRAYVRQKGTLFVECEANGTPIPSISWENEGVLITTKGKVRVQRSSGRLRIAGANQDVMGIYSCIAINSVGRDRQDIEVVLEDPPKPRMSIQGKAISGNRISVKEGDQTVVNCSKHSSQSDVDLQWTGPSGLHEANSQMTSVTIKGTRNAAAMAGRYWCSGNNAVGSSKTVLDVDIERLAFETHLRDGVYINNVPATVTSRGTAVQTGSQLAIDCRGVTNPKIVWHKDGSALSSLHTKWFDVMKSRNRSVVSSRLRINAIEMSHSGVYTCVITNGILKKKSSVAVSVGGFPVIWTSDQPVAKHGNLVAGNVGDHATSLMGDTIMIDCPLVNTPMNTSVVWMKDGRQTMDNNIQVMSNGTLVVKNASISNGGDFMCHASNSMGSSARPFTLRVLRKPGMLLKNVKHMKGKYEYDISMNKELRIDCSGSGFPTPTFSWKKGRKAISHRGQVLYQESGLSAELVISDVQLDDAGTYVCEANNEAGIERKEVQVFVSAGNSTQAFNYSVPDLNAAIGIPKAVDVLGNGDRMGWTEIDPSGRMTTYDSHDSWFEEAGEEENLINRGRGRRHQECSGYLDVSLLKSRMGDRHGRSVVGTGDERIAVVNTQSWPQRAAGVIYFTIGDQLESMPCTGTLINERHVLTAAHCISDGEGKFYRNIAFYPAANGNVANPFPYGAYSWTKLYCVRGYHRDGHAGYDYGVIVLNASVGHYMAFREAQFTAESEDTVTVNQYPSDLQDPRPSMWQATCPVGSPLFPGSNLVYSHTCDTAAGASGGGMYLPYADDSDPPVVFVHTGIGSLTTNRAVTIDRSKFLQLCHWIKNSGGVVDPGSACDVKTTKGDTAQTTG